MLVEHFRKVKSMDKISYIDEYIERCSRIIDEKDSASAKSLSSEIIGVFSHEISNITGELDAYMNHYSYESTDYLGDIRILKQKLLNHKYNLQLEKDKMAHELELARLRQPTITAHAESNQSQVQSTSNNISITIENTISKIDEIPEETLSADDKEKLKEYLYSLEGMRASKNKTKFWDKAKEVLKFIADKSADTAIALLPYIIYGITT